MNKRTLVFAAIGAALCGCSTGPVFPELAQVAGECRDGWAAAGNPLARVADRNGDGRSELLVAIEEAGRHRVELRSGSDGAVLWSREVDRPASRATFVDLNADGAEELLISTVELPAEEDCAENCSGGTEQAKHFLEAIAVSEGALGWSRAPETAAPWLNSVYAVVDDEDGDGVIGLGHRDEAGESMVAIGSTVLEGDERRPVTFVYRCRAG